MHRFVFGVFANELNAYIFAALNQNLVSSL